MEGYGLTDVQFWVGFINIIILDLILSGDNAVVIGMATRNLKEKQRKKAIVFGAGAAILLRATITAIATYLLKVPLLMTAGGILLLWIAVKLLLEEDEGKHVSAGTTLRSAIKTIITADVVMSLDNVLAVAGSAHGNIFLVLFGLALSIPIIMWGSGLVAKVMNRIPWLIFVGAAILGYTSGKLIVDDPYIAKTILAGQEGLSLGIPLVLAVLITLIGYTLKRMGKHKTA